MRNSLCCVVCGIVALASCTVHAAEVSGVVMYSGRAPSNALGGVFGEGEAIHDPAARPLEFAYIYLERLDPWVIEPAPTTEKASVFMDQVSFRFVPLVLAARSGQTIVFGNGDSTDHNIRAISENERNEFNIITRPGKTYEKRFEAQTINAPVRLACDFHPSMEAWIYVVDGPFSIVTGDDGVFDFSDVPPGRYKLNVRDPSYRMRAQSELTVGDESLSVQITFGVQHRHYRDEPPVQISTKSTTAR